MEKFRWIMLLVIWSAMIFSLVSGYYYTPNFIASRREDPRSYWVAMAVGTLLAVVATVILMQFH